MSSTNNQTDLNSLLQQLPACKRCRDCRRGCDTLLPACRQCTKAGAECVFLDHALNEYLPRSYIASLVDHVHSIQALSGTTSTEQVLQGSASSSAAQMTEGVESDEFKHCFARFGTTYRYLGKSSCLSPFASLPEPASSKEKLAAIPFLDIQARQVILNIDAKVHDYLVRTFFRTIHILFPILDPTLTMWSFEECVDLSATDIFMLYMVYSISCHTVAGTGSQWIVLGDYCRKHALSYIENSTTEPNIATLRSVLLLTVASLFDPENGNTGQQLALASRLALDLETQDVDAQDASVLLSIHSAIFCIENEFTGTLGRPATFPEPASDLTFDHTVPSLFLCSLYRIQHRYRKGDMTVLDLLPDQQPPETGAVSATLSAVLQKTRFLADPSRRNAIDLLHCLAKSQALLIFSTPHWAFRAGIVALNSRISQNSQQVLDAYGNALSILVSSAHRWPSVSGLADSLREHIASTI